MEDMECDTLAQNGIHLITVLGKGEERTTLVWRIKDEGGVEENPLDEIDFSETDLEDSKKASSFKMKSGVVMSGDTDGEDVETVILMFQVADSARFKTIQKKFHKF